MWRYAVLLLGGVSALAAQTIRDVTLDPRQAVDLPVSREITTVTFPGPITAVAGTDMLVDRGKEAVEVEEGTPLRFQVTHAPGTNFILVRSLQPEATGRLTAIYDDSAYVIQLRTVEANSVASVIFHRAVVPAAVEVESPPEPVKFSPRIGLSLLDRARAFPVLVKTLPKAVEGGDALRAESAGGIAGCRDHRPGSLPFFQGRCRRVFVTAEEHDRPGSRSGAEHLRRAGRAGTVRTIDCQRSAHLGAGRERRCGVCHRRPSGRHAQRSDRR